MIHVSDEFKSLIRQRTDFKGYAEVTLADGTALTFADDAFLMSGNCLTDGAGVSELPLGAAICRTVTLELVNTDGELDAYDFFGARIRLWLTFHLSKTTEKIDLGVFTVTEPETWGETVTITAGDDMTRADRDYTPSASGNVTLGELWRDVCGRCGLHYATASFPNSGLRVPVPEAGSYTCRQMLGYIAMLAGGNARISRNGTAEILSYDKSRGADHTLDGWSSLNTDTDDVLITGLEMRTDGTTWLEGGEGYVLVVENPLAAGLEAEALRRMGDILIGLRLRRFSGEHVAYPLAEFMDTVRLTDRKGRSYTSVITDVTFAFGGFTSLANSAAGVVRNGSKYVSAETRARIATRKMVEQERTSRELAMERMNETLKNASGLYSTPEVQPDGSTIYFLHDKPALDQSKLVMKLTAEAIGLSTDGGKTYPYGFTVTGEMVMGIISAEGINADWITTGMLKSLNDKAYFDLVRGKVYTTGKLMSGSVGEVSLDTAALIVKTDGQEVTHVGSNGGNGDSAGDGLITLRYKRNGRYGMTLEPAQAGGGVRLYDVDGKTRGFFNISGDQLPNMGLLGPDGKYYIHAYGIASTADGAQYGALDIYGPNGTRRLGLGFRAGQGHRPSVAVSGDDGQTRGALYEDDSGRGTVQLRDENNQPRVLLGGMGDGRASCRFYDREGQYVGSIYEGIDGGLGLEAERFAVGKYGSDLASCYWKSVTDANGYTYQVLARAEN